MRGLKIQFAIVGLLISSIGAYAQAPLSLYGMKKIPQSSLLNPAHRSEANFFIGIPLLSSIGLQFHNSGFALEELIGKEVEDPNDAIREIAAGLDNDDILHFNLRTELLFLGFNMGDNGFLTFGADLNQLINFNYPSDLVRFAFPSQEDFESTDIDLSGTRYEVLAYSQVHLGYQHSLLDNKLSVGGRVKFNNVYGNIYVEKLDAVVDGQTDRMLVSTDILIRTAGIAPFEDGVDFTSGQLFGGNTGFTFDLGASYSISPKLEVMASVLDLGTINFTKDLRDRKSKGSYEFTGLEFNAVDGETNDQTIGDQIDSVFNFTEVDGNAYSRALTNRYFIGASYSLSKSHSFQGTYNLNRWDGLSFHNASLGYVGDYGKGFQLMLNWNMINSTYMNFGGGFGLDMGAFQWYLLSDNFYGMISPGAAQTVGFRTGFNLKFGRDRMKERKMEGIVVPQTIPTNTSETK